MGQPGLPWFLYAGADADAGAVGDSEALGTADLGQACSHALRGGRGDFVREGECLGDGLGGCELHHVTSWEERSVVCRLAEYVLALGPLSFSARSIVEIGTLYFRQARQGPI